MKNSTTPNRKTGRMIAKNLIVLLTVAIAAYFGIQAWFTEKQTATAENINLECQLPDGIEIAIVPHNAAAPTDKQYVSNEDGKKITLSKDNYQFIDNLKMTEVSSDGYKFYKPALQQIDGMATPITDVNWEDADYTTHYLSFDLYVRSKSDYNIYIDKTSVIKPNATILTGADADNKSDFGESGISRDCVVGAARFSIVNYNKHETKLLWIPAPNIFLNAPKGTATDKYTVNTGARKGESYTHNYYVNNGGKWEKTSVSSGDDSALSKVFVANANAFDDDGHYTYQLGTKKEIMTLKKETTDAEFSTGMVTCNLWIDGEDAEARLALVNGKFDITMVLTKNES